MNLNSEWPLKSLDFGALGDLPPEDVCLRPLCPRQ